MTPQQLEQLALELTAHTAQPWTPITPADDWRASIAGPEGMALRVSTRDRRIHVSGEYPRGVHGAHNYMPYKHELPCITIDARRSPYEMAKDIAARFLPAYREALLIVSRAIREEEKRRATEDSAAQLLARAYGPGARVRERSQWDQGYAAVYIDGGSAEIHVYENAIQVEIKALAGIKTAAEVLRLIGKDK